LRKALKSDYYALFAKWPAARANDQVCRYLVAQGADINAIGSGGSPLVRTGARVLLLVLSKRRQRLLMLTHTTMAHAVRHRDMEHARCLVRCGARHHQQTVADGDEDGEILAQLMAEVAAPKPAAPEMSSIQQQQQQQEERALEDDVALRPAKRAKVEADADGEEVERRLIARLRRMRSGSGWPRPPPPPAAGAKGVVVGSSKLPWHYLRRLATTKCGVRAGALATTTRTELLHVVYRSLPPERPTDDDDDADSPPIDDEEVEEEGELGDDELLQQHQE
jgi:hypothetical protein